MTHNQDVDSHTVSDWQKVFRTELNALGHDADKFVDKSDKDAKWTPPRRTQRSIERNYLTGICLSGGGIRSALISLGALEVFARNDLLKHFDYLSSVSGGGYAAAAMSHFWALRDQTEKTASASGASSSAWRNMDHPFDSKAESVASLRSTYMSKYIKAEDERRELLLRAGADRIKGEDATASTKPDLPKTENTPQKTKIDTSGQGNQGGRSDDKKTSVRTELEAEFESVKNLPDHADLNMETPWEKHPAQQFSDNYLRHLRTHVSYLMPNGVFGALSGGLVVVRAILLNLFIWIALGSGFIALLLTGGDALSKSEQNIFAGVFDSIAFLKPLTTDHNFIFAIFAVLAICAVVLILGMMVLFSISSYVVKTTQTDERKGLETQASRISLALIALGMTVGLIHFEIASKWAALTPVGLVILTSLYLWITWAIGAKSENNGRKEAVKYNRRRIFESLSGRLMFFAIICFCVGILPVIAENLNLIDTALNEKGDKGADAVEGATRPTMGAAASTGLLSALVSVFGIGSGLAGYAGNRLVKQAGIGMTKLVPIGATLFVFSALVLAYVVARVHWQDNWDTMVALTIVAVFLAIFVNINDVSLGRFYRDRLMETFMPDPQKLVDDVQDSTRPAATKADKLLLRELEPVAKRNSPQDRNYPMHLVCCNVVASESKDAKARRRLGDSFVLSGIFCGSDTTKWRETKEVAKGNLRLSTAMAISGAAANPQGGFAGTGPTTGPMVSLAMSLLSIRLGYWLRWNKPWKLTRGLGALNPYGNHIRPNFIATLGRLFGSRYMTEELAGFREITDGGHFENLGIYELVRRRCGLIVVVDGGQDPSATYQSFTSSLRRIEEDFDAKIVFDVELDEHPTNRFRTEMRNSGPEDIVMRKASNGFPKDVEFAKKGYFMATVHYSDTRAEFDHSDIKPGVRQQAKHGPECGLLIYLKSTMLEELAPTTKGYRGVNEDFPFDPTSNQFYSSAQFEAYRDVGSAVAEQMLRDTQLARLFRNDKRPDMSDLLGNYAFQVQGPASKY